MIRTPSPFLPVVMAVTLMLAALLPARADLPTAEGPALLTVTLPDGRDVALDAGALDSLPLSSFTTSTIWTEGPQTFEGVRLHDLLEAFDVAGGAITMTAVNDYEVTAPLAELRPEGALLAYRRNGRAMSLRDKGPIWLVYPYDSSAQFRTEVVYANSIWQLDRIRLGQ